MKKTLSKHRTKNNRELHLAVIALSLSMAAAILQGPVANATNVTVTFDGNGGSQCAPDQSASTLTALTTNTCVREGYEFVGWNLTSVGDSDAWLDADDYDFANLTDDTLYAQWIPANSFRFNSGQHKRGNALIDQSTVTQPLASDDGSIMGNDMELNDYFDFYNVATINGVNVGARVTFLGSYGSSGDSLAPDQIDRLDADADGDDNESNYLLKSELDFDTAFTNQDSYAEVRISFFRDLGPTNFITVNPPVAFTVSNLKLSIYDIDNQQWVSIEGFNRYFLSDSTQVTHSTSNVYAYPTFVSPDSNTSGSDSFSIGRATVEFNSIQTFRIRMGVQKEYNIEARDVDGDVETSATYLLDFGPGLPWSGGITPETFDATPSPALNPYTGPIPTSLSVTCVPAGQASTAVLTGERLNTITSAEVDGKAVAVSEVTATSVKLALPALTAGTYSVIYNSSSGRLTHQDSLRVCATSSAVTQGPGPFTITQRFTGYRGDRGPVVARDLRAITAFIQANPGLTSVTCTGSTSGVPAKSTDRALATARATNACNIVKRLVPGITTSISTITGQGVGQFHRAVIITGQGIRP
jgi:uncharacterized repeat protein (TIGR02543 family)